MPRPQLWLSPRRFARKLGLCLLLSLPASPLPAQPPEAETDLIPLDSVAGEGATSDQRPVSLSIFYENDGTFVRANGYTDRHYTSGQGFAVMWHPQSAEVHVDGPTNAFGLTLVQQMYTPANITTPRPRPDGRFYAGYLYLGGIWQRQDGNVFDHVELDLGVVGPSSGADAVQEMVHDVFDELDPDWSTQVEDELAINLTLRRKWRVDLGETEVAGTPLQWQLIPRAEVDVGNVYRRAGVGTDVRFGYHLPDDFGASSMTDLGAATGRPVDGFSWYVFGSAVGRYVEWNTFLDGSNTRDPSPSVSKEPFVGEFAAGFAFEWRKSNWVFNTSYTQTHLTRDFETQREHDAYGSLAVRFLYEF